jgi:integrase
MQVTALIDWYFSSRSFAKLAPSSQRHYRYMLKRASAVLGHRAVGRINAVVADTVFDQLSTSFSQQTAIQSCRILAHIWKLGLRYELASHNPFQSMELPMTPSRTILWTEDQVWDFVNTCKESGYASLGLLAELCYVFAQRPGDMRQLRWRNLDGNRLSFIQEKTGTAMSLWVPEFLKEELDEHTVEPDSYICINPDTDSPYSARDYNKLAFDMKRRAHIPLELQFRDLRRTALTEVDDDESARRLGGHKSDRSLMIYRLNRSEQTKKVQDSRFPQRRRK